ncbi:MAG: hypothetical protein ACOVNV_12770, partial [Pirellulaceae bacterium]
RDPLCPHRWFGLLHAGNALADALRSVGDRPKGTRQADPDLIGQQSTTAHLNTSCLR